MNGFDPTPAGATRPHVVVIGGGFGGLETVRALRRAPVDITLVDRHAYNTFQPLLYQVATAGLNPGDITYFLRSVSARQSNVRFRKGEVVGVDPDAQTVALETGETLTYDYLVVASGVTTNWFGIPGAEEHALALYTRRQSLAVRDRIFAFLEHAAANGSDRDLRIVVVGGGATGVEMAGALAEMRNQGLGKVYPELDPKHIHVALIEMADRLLLPFHPKLSRYAAKQLTKRGTDLRLSTAVAEVRPDAVVVKDGEVIPAEVVIWATGIKVPDAVSSWGLPLGKGGRIVVDEDLRVQGHDNVFAIGDIALTPEPLAQLAQPALQGGKHVGREIRAAVRGDTERAHRPFHYRDKGILATIGRSAAVAEISHVPKLKGFVAWMIWLFVHIIGLLGNRNRITTLVNLSVRYLAWPRTFNVIVGEVPTPDWSDTRPR
ncbi:MAG TPA: NAD(P)/FAD-dependent oxidoreductase [Nocardioidaceae bacterium]|nr:NAD(P)/FAD-dependent oxidoreductase [Nocardioidaceae bacterium]